MVKGRDHARDALGSGEAPEAAEDEIGLVPAEACTHTPPGPLVSQNGRAMMDDMDPASRMAPTELTGKPLVVDDHRSTRFRQPSCEEGGEPVRFLDAGCANGRQASRLPGHGIRGTEREPLAPQRLLHEIR